MMCASQVVPSSWRAICAAGKQICMYCGVCSTATSIMVGANLDTHALCCSCTAMYMSIPPLTRLRCNVPHPKSVTLLQWKCELHILQKFCKKLLTRLQIWAFLLRKRLISSTKSIKLWPSHTLIQRVKYQEYFVKFIKI